MDILTIGLVIAAALLALIIGITFAKFSDALKDRKLKKQAKAFLNGESYNIIDVEGEKIHINKFSWKDKDGNKQSAEITLQKKPY